MRKGVSGVGRNGGGAVRRWKPLYSITFSDAELVNEWLNITRKGWFENRGNDLYGRELNARAVAEYWLMNETHGEDYNDKNIIYLQKKWNDFIRNFEVEAEG
jgi:hypothetical protein